MENCLELRFSHNEKILNDAQNEDERVLAKKWINEEEDAICPEQTRLNFKYWTGLIYHLLSKYHSDENLKTIF